MRLTFKYVDDLAKLFGLCIDNYAPSLYSVQVDMGNGTVSHLFSGALRDCYSFLQGYRTCIERNKM